MFDKNRKFYSFISEIFDHYQAMKAMAKHSELPHVTGCHTASPLSCTMVSESLL